MYCIIIIGIPIGPNIQINRFPELFPPITAHVTLQMYSNTYLGWCSPKRRDGVQTAKLGRVLDCSFTILNIVKKFWRLTFTLRVLSAFTTCRETDFASLYWCVLHSSTQGAPSSIYACSVMHTAAEKLYQLRPLSEFQHTSS